MSVIVKGCGLPNFCWVCEGCDGDKNVGLYCSLTQNAKNSEKFDISKIRPNWCPLIGISNLHSRYLDGNELHNIIKGHYNNKIDDELITWRILARL